MTNRLKLFAVTGWCLAVIGFGGLFLALWTDSRKSAYVTALDRVAEQLVAQIEQSEKAGGMDVVPFSDYSGRVPQVGLFLADYLGSSLQKRTKQVHVLDRANLAEILSEQRLAASGVVDPQTSTKIGELEAAKMLLVGNIDLHQGWITLNVRVVDIETARNIASASSSMVATEQMAQLWQQALAEGRVNQVTQEIRRQRQWAEKNPGRDALKSVAIDFFVKNWPWLWTVLLVPVFTWVVGKIRRKKEETEPGAATKEKAA